MPSLPNPPVTVTRPASSRSTPAPKPRSYQQHRDGAGCPPLITRNDGRAFGFAKHLDAGMVGINHALPSVTFTPMGGTKTVRPCLEDGTDGLRDIQETTYLARRP